MVKQAFFETCILSNVLVVCVRLGREMNCLAHLHVANAECVKTVKNVASVPTNACKQSEEKNWQWDFGMWKGVTVSHMLPPSSSGQRLRGDGEVAGGPAGRGRGLHPARGPPL